MRDIQTKADIELLVNSFYSKLLLEEELAPVFRNINMEQHIPHIVHFWSFVLLDEEGYKTNVFDKHLSLPIQPHFFDTWLRIFLLTVNELFSGEIADMAKTRATSLTYTFKSKWEKIRGH